MENNNFSPSIIQEKTSNLEAKQTNSFLVNPSTNFHRENMGETGARTASKDQPQDQLAEVTAEGAPTTLPPSIEPVQVTRWMGERPWVHHIRGLNH